MRCARTPNSSARLWNRNCQMEFQCKRSASEARDTKNWGPMPLHVFSTSFVRWLLTTQCWPYRLFVWIFVVPKLQRIKDNIFLRRHQSEWRFLMVKSCQRFSFAPFSQGLHWVLTFHVSLFGVIVKQKKQTTTSLQDPQDAACHGYVGWAVHGCASRICYGNMCHGDWNGLRRLVGKWGDTWTSRNPKLRQVDAMTWVLPVMYVCATKKGCILPN